MPFGHIVAKFQENWYAREVAAVIFRTRGHEKLGIWTFLFLFKMAEICGGGGIWGKKTIVGHKSVILYQ